jgi:hypothetical protein
MVQLQLLQYICWLVYVCTVRAAAAVCMLFGVCMYCMCMYVLRIYDVCMYVCMYVLRHLRLLQREVACI